jgi:hypothetical protein
MATQLYKKSYGKESKLSYLSHALVENRNGLIAAAMVTHVDGYAERDAALLMLHEMQRHRSRRITVSADKAYDTKYFVATAREMKVTPHVTKNEKGRRSNLDQRTARPNLGMPSASEQMAGRERLRLAEPDRPAATGQITWTGKGGLVVRLQLCRSQPDPAAQAHRVTQEVSLREQCA